MTQAVAAGACQGVGQREPRACKVMELVWTNPLNCHTMSDTRRLNDVATERLSLRIDADLK